MLVAEHVRTVAEELDQPVDVGVAAPLGQFALEIDGFAELAPAGRGDRRFAEPRDGAKSECDIIVDLAGGQPLFPAHPYGRPVGGPLESVAAITRADLKGFARRRLAKDNLTIGVVGDITAEALKLVLDKIFGGLPAKAGAWAIPEAVLKGQGRTVVVIKQAPQSAIIFADKGPKRQDKDFYAAYVMNYVLGGGGFTSRLYNTVREKRGLAYSVYSTLHPLERAGLIFGGAGTANKSASETIAVMRAEWTRMARKGMSEKELADAKTYLTGSYPLSFTSSSRIASMLIGIQMDTLGIDYPDRRNGLIEAVTLGDVNRLAKKLLRPDQLTVVVVGQPDGVKSTN